LGYRLDRIIGDRVAPSCSLPELSATSNHLDTIAPTHQIPQTFAFERHQLEVRSVREEEIYLVADIISRSFHFDRGWMGLFTPLFKLGIAEDLRHRLRANKPSYGNTQQQVCSIAVCSHLGYSQVVGTIEVGLRTTNYRQPTPHRYVYISNLAVSQEFRRRGVAQELLLKCECLAKEWGYTQIHLHVMSDNEGGRHLYRKLGYEVVSSEYVWSFFPWYRPERLFLRKQLTN
jgi:ribosomal protein S18 acetylase RimI-like enzyme